jgi:lauroyl/myristoyl acyltransferase
MRIAKSGGSQALRQAITEMSKGTLIGLAPETPDAKEALTFEFLGRKIALSALAPRLVWNQGAACIWWHALWRDGRIVIEAERLPDPERDEPELEWCRRWAAAYLERVACVMRGSPENLVLRGIWSNAD